MGLREIFGGRKKLKGPAPDRLFAMSTAYVTLETEIGLTSTHQAAIVFQALPTTDFEAIVKDMEEVLHGTGADAGTTVERRDDSFGYRWMILRDEDFEDLVVGLNAVNSALRDGGYGDRVLAALFSFKNAEGNPVYFIYNVKRGSWYPFVPRPGQDKRDTESELRLKAQLERELPMEPELERWFPLWGAPL